MENEYQGALLDERPEERKAKDFKSDNPELASAVQLNWVEKKPEEWKNYPSRNQVNSSSCVAQAMSKALYTMQKGVVSAHPIYRSRKNFSEKGMWLYDGADILKKQGTVGEDQDMSQNVNEDFLNMPIANVVEDILKTTPIKIGGYVYVANCKNIDEIAQAIEEHGHCVITVGSNYAEWSSIPEVQGDVKWYHGICAIDYVLYNGKKYIVIEDSWGSNIGQFDDRRLLSEEFIKTRCTGALFFLPYTPPSPIHHVFTQKLQRGDSGEEVLFLQNALKQLKFFPDMATTKFYGVITEHAINNFQMYYKDDILTPLGLTQPTGRFGSATMAKLNSLL